MIQADYKGLAGLRDQRRNRITGSLSSLYDGRQADLDTDGGRWQTVCEEHGTICSHDTLARAKAFLSAPEEWCEECTEIDSKRTGVEV